MIETKTGKIYSKSLKQNIFRVLVTNFWVAIVGFLGSFVFPKILSVQDYALYHTFTLYIGYIAILHLGFPSGMVVNYAGKNYVDIDKKQYKSEMIILICILLFFTSSFLIVSLILNSLMLFFVSCAIMPVCLISSYYALLQAWSRFKRYSRLNMFITSAIPIIAFTHYLIRGHLPGNIYIIIYLSVYWAIMLWIVFQEGISLCQIKANKLLSKQNFITEKTGISLVIGNYMVTLFCSLDKQFVNWFFGAEEFAFYSFSMAMQTLMTIFITSISQPLFPAMANGKFSNESYPTIKRILFVFGSFSCCAYFAISIVIKLFIHKYVGSLEIVRLYFIIFPAMAVVNCIYVNLYKIQNRMYLYIKTIAFVLLCAIILNTVAVFIFKNYSGVALATAVTYYIWLFIGSKQFHFMKLEFRDIAYIISFAFGFYLVTMIKNDVIGLFCSIIFVLALCVIFYYKEILNVLKGKIVKMG